jgi:hypothetical protein
MLKKKIGALFQKIIELFTQKIVTKLSKIWLWDPGSGKNLFRDPEKTYSGSRGQKGTGSRIQIRNTGIPNAAEQRMGMGKHREYLMYYRGPGFPIV